MLEYLTYFYSSETAINENSKHRQTVSLSVIFIVNIAKMSNFV